ncbi:MAG: DUF1491 family protein [Sphingomonadaceae bacterium]|nr:DUF1491 family protein [Sphingomonadaceae bacterium]
MDGRLPAHIEVSGLIRAAEAQGGFGTVLAKGERDAGTILILTMQRGANAQLWERMPQLDGSRSWTVTKTQSLENSNEMAEYLDRRRRQDSDIWIVELDIADAQRFAALQQNLG